MRSVIGVRPTSCYLCNWETWYTIPVPYQASRQLRTMLTTRFLGNRFDHIALWDSIVGLAGPWTAAGGWNVIWVLDKLCRSRGGEVRKWKKYFFVVGTSNLLSKVVQRRSQPFNGSLAPTTASNSVESVIILHPLCEFSYALVIPVDVWKISNICCKCGVYLEHDYVRGPYTCVVLSYCSKKIRTQVALLQANPTEKWNTKKK